MSQPIKRRLKKISKIEVHGTGNGIDYCDECPFLGVIENKMACVTNNITFKEKENIPIPDWCGNKGK